jgi:hypothetical protein
MTTPLSIHHIPDTPAPAPASGTPQTLTRVPWAAMARALADPAWVPGWQALPIWAMDPEAILDAVTEHSGSDTLSTHQTIDLVARIARRNALEARRLLDRMADGGLDSLVADWTAVLEAWAAAAEDDAIDLTAGPVAVAIAQYLTTAARLGLTVAQAEAFAACPDEALRRAVASPGAVTRARVAMAAHPTATYTEVARIAGITAAYCRVIVDRYGDPCRAQRTTDTRPARIRELASQGLSYRAIAREVGCSLGYISKVMK